MAIGSARVARRTLADACVQCGHALDGSRQVSAAAAGMSLFSFSCSSLRAYRLRRRLPPPPPPSTRPNLNRTTAPRCSFIEMTTNRDHVAIEIRRRTIKAELCVRPERAGAVPPCRALLRRVFGINQSCCELYHELLQGKKRACFACAHTLPVDSTLSL